jgi:hypothetical protein
LDAVLPDQERLVREGGLECRLAAGVPGGPPDIDLGSRERVSRIDPDAYPRHFTRREPVREPEDLTLRRTWADLLAAKAAALAAGGRKEAAGACARQAVQVAAELTRGPVLPGPIDPLQPAWAALAFPAVAREPGYWHDLACHLALASTLPGGSPGDEAARAVSALREWVATGCGPSDALAADPRLAPLHGRDDFQRLVRDAAGVK